VIDVIDSEMEEIGSQRVTTPTLHPIEIWQKTNRDQAFGGEMMVVEDHHGSTFAVGATAEGLMTELIKSKNPSYNDLPIVIHQFVQKFRDEKRPRGGLLRVREFMMKDAYSFHESEEDLLKWYEVFSNSYKKIAKLFGLDVIPVLADSGAIGGEYNHEFMVLADKGEDRILICNKCDYAANQEKAEGGFTTHKQDKEQKSREDVEGKGVVGVEELAKFLEIPIEVTTKTLIYKTNSGQIVAAMVRGDYGINETKLRNYLNVDGLTLADEETVKKVTGAEVGYAGPIDLPKKVTVVADFTCKDRVNFEVGANKTDYHSLNVNFGRDFPTPDFADIRQARDGDACIKCKRAIKIWAKEFCTFTNYPSSVAVEKQSCTEHGFNYHRNCLLNTKILKTATAEDGLIDTNSIMNYFLVSVSTQENLYISKVVAYKLISKFSQTLSEPKLRAKYPNPPKQYPLP